MGYRRRHRLGGIGRRSGQTGYGLGSVADLQHLGSSQRKPDFLTNPETAGRGRRDSRSTLRMQLRK